MNDEASTRTVIIIVVVVVVAIAAGAVLLLSTRPEPIQITINPPVPTETPAPTSTPEPILVYVTGAVANPQTTVELAADSRVQDAIDAAGGATGDADMERVNVVGILHDGDHVHVFAQGEPEEAALPTPGGGGIVYVNTATAEELQTLPGIGPALAQRIIEYRAENGPFADLEALDAVRGIGPALLEQLEELISFE